MGLLLSVVISYAGVNEAIECVRHIISGIVPETQPDFQDLVDYYTLQLRKSRNANPSGGEWSKECGQGYLDLTEDKNGYLKSVAVRYYGDETNSTAILFSTKISSFGQESVDENDNHANGHYKNDRYIQTKTKTILNNNSESLNFGRRSRSPASRERNAGINTVTSASVERDDHIDENGADEKLTWSYRPKSPNRNPQTLPEIHFQTFDDDKRGVYTEDFLRSLDGIKFRPLQRSDPSGRRRSFKKRHSSSSNSSRDSRASRDEELMMFTSLEEAEFERMNTDAVGVFTSTPNLSARSHSRSRSRDKSRDGRAEHWSLEGSVDSTTHDENGTLNPHIKDVPKLNSFEEETTENKEVIQEEDDIDFWGNSED